MNTLPAVSPNLYVAAADHRHRTSTPSLTPRFSSSGPDLPSLPTSPLLTMKTATILPTLALLAGSSIPTQAALTTYNTTYDLLLVSVYGEYGAVAEIVADTNSVWLTRTYNTVVDEIESDLASGQHTYPYYVDRLTSFLEDAANKDASKYTALSDAYATSDLSLASYLVYAARPFCDMVFDTVETFLPTLKNQTLSTWHRTERQAMEKRVLNGTHADALADAMVAYLTTLGENDAASAHFEAASNALADRAQDAYDIEYEIEHEDEDEGEEGL